MHDDRKFKVSIHRTTGSRGPAFPNVVIRRSKVTLRVRTCAIRGSFRNKSSKDMALPHPKSRKNKPRNEDKPRGGCVVWNLVKRAINVTEYRNAKDEVNPAKNRTCGGFGGDRCGDEGRLLQGRFHGVPPPFRYCYC